MFEILLFLIFIDFDTNPAMAPTNKLIFVGFIITFQLMRYSS